MGSGSNLLLCLVEGADEGCGMVSAVESYARSE